MLLLALIVFIWLIETEFVNSLSPNQEEYHLRTRSAVNTVDKHPDDNIRRFLASHSHSHLHQSKSAAASPKTWNDGFGETFGEGLGNAAGAGQSSSGPVDKQDVRKDHKQSPSLKTQSTMKDEALDQQQQRNHRSSSSHRHSNGHNSGGGQSHNTHTHAHGYHYRNKASTIIVDENRKPGTKEWFTPQPTSASFIEGFTASFSHYPGDMVNFKINCSIIPSHIPLHEIRVYRLGYYNETGGRLVAKLVVNNAQCRKQPTCSFFEEDRLVSCKTWEINAKWRVPIDMPSGVFVGLPMLFNTDCGISTSTALAALNDARGKSGKGKDSSAHSKAHATATAAAVENAYIFGGHILFVVKESRTRKHASEVLFKTSDLTWVAYNKYGGFNLYHNSTSKHFAGRAYRASYDRPFHNRIIYPLGFSQNFLFNSEFPMLYWLEKHGYDISYASCADIEVLYEEQRLYDHKVLLSIGHDEYWTPSMRKAYHEARDHGVHLGFFSSNEMFWRTIWEDNYHPELSFDMESVFPGFMSKIRKSKDQFRVMVCKKETLDLLSSPSSSSSSLPSKLRDDLWTGTFDDPRSRSLPEPTVLLTGQVFAANSYQSASMVVGRDESILRLWRNTSIVVSYRKSALSSPMDSSSQESSKVTSSDSSTNSNATANWVYETPSGLLGYELDSYREDMFNPPGLISFSSTKLYIHKALVENYGTSYSGSGWIDHRVTLYRYYIDKIRYRAHDHIEDFAQAQRELCQAVNQATLSSAAARRNSHHEHDRTALVFSTGTMQWSWALSSFRDGDIMAEDYNIQQATLNILADMYVLPYSFRSKVTTNPNSHSKRSQPRSLAMPTAPTDRLAPVSKIQIFHHNTHNTASQHSTHGNNHHNSANQHSTTRLSNVHTVSVHQTKKLSITGTAVDLGGGRVAAVEVSVDGGRTWHLATGRYNWYYNHYFDQPVELFNETRLFNESYHYPSMDSNAVISLRDAMIQEGLLYSEYHHHIEQHSNDSFTLTHRKSHRHSATAQRLHRRHNHVNGPESTVSVAHSSPLHLHMLVISRAIDDSGWIESYDTRLESVLCDLAKLSSSSKHAYSGGDSSANTITTFTSHLPNNMAYFSVVL